MWEQYTFDVTLGQEWLRADGLVQAEITFYAPESKIFEQSW